MTQILTETARIEAWGRPCKLVGGELVMIDDRLYDVNPAFASGWVAWEMVRAAYKYAMPGSDTGHYSCRHIANDPNRPWSEHAWRGLAFDMNWLQNPDGKTLVTDMPAGMTPAIQKIRTVSGEFVFRWGGDWDRTPETPHAYYDAMHFSQTASPDDLASGIDWTTVQGAELGRLEQELNDAQITYLIDKVKQETDPDGFAMSPTSGGHAVEFLRAVATTAGVSPTDEAALASWIAALASTLDATSLPVPHTHLGLSDRGNVLG
jgi:hypothetical protein